MQGGCTFALHRYCGAVLTCCIVNNFGASFNLAKGLSIGVDKVNFKFGDLNT